MNSLSGARVLLGIIAACLLAFPSCKGRASAPQSSDAEASLPVETESADPGELRFNAYKQKNLNFALEGDDFPYNLKGLKDVHIAAALTGEYSINKTSSNYGVFGTDIGVIFDKGDELFFAFGDSFSGPDFSGNWRSNVLAVSSDRDASDGILFDRMITNKIGQAIEILHSRKQDNIEMTVIPTGGFSIGDTLYLCFMSVRHWGVPGQWDCNYGGIAKSENSGLSWEKLPQLQWDGEGAFVQLAPVKDGPYIYFYGIGGGRTGSVSLMRVNAGSAEDKQSYEYLTGLTEKGEAVYEKGVEAEKNPYIVIQRPAGELSVMYNPYLEEWLITCLSNEDLIMRSSKTLEGPFSKAHYIARQSDYPSLYGAFMHPAYTEENGRILYFMTSFYDPIYNVSVLRAEAAR